MIKCKNCENEVNQKWKVCPFCGKEIEKELKCENCGFKLEENWEMCPNCGVKIGELSKKVEVGNNMVFVKGGTFQMGSNDWPNKSDEQPVHSVTLNDFYIDKYAVTFKEYDEYCEDTGRDEPDSDDWGRRQRPVIEVSWYDAIRYCNWRSRKEGLEPCYHLGADTDIEDYDDDDLKDVVCDFTKNGYRLSTEAEWEYAARDGNKSCGYQYAGSNNIDEVAWYEDNSDDKTHPVGAKRANKLSIYDMSGNVCEWCWDWFGDYSSSSQTNPKGADSGSERVLRGCGWRYSNACNGVANRNADDPADGSYLFGFRLVRSSR